MPYLTWVAYMHISAGVGSVVPSLFLLNHLVSPHGAVELYIFTL